MTPQRIKEESAKYVNKRDEALQRRPIDYSRRMGMLDGLEEGYIAGATAENERTEDEIDKALHAERNKMQVKFSELDKQYAALLKEQRERAQDLVDALEGIDNSPTPYNEREMKSWIETARALVSEALAKWKGEQPQVELSCIVCGTKFMGPEPQMCCSGRDCGCMGLPIDPIVCSKECYEKGLPRQKGDSGVAIN